MANNKKGIIVYADWIDKFEELDDDEAGRLIKHFFRYVNDMNPEYPDKLTKIAFLDIKNSLKRDLDKWEQTLEGRSRAGKASVEARRLLKIKEQSLTNLTSVNPVEKDLTKLTDSVTVSVSVNDTVTESENVKEKSISNSSFKNTLLKNEKWKKSISEEFKISIDEVELKLGIFETHLFKDQKFHPTMHEFTKHFRKWVPVNKEKNGNNKNNTGTLSKNR